VKGNSLKLGWFGGVGLGPISLLFLEVLGLIINERTHKPFNLNF